MPRRLSRGFAVALAILLLLGLAASLAWTLYGRWRLDRAAERFTALYGAPELARFMRPEPPPERNAATWLLAGAGAVVLPAEEDGLLYGSGGAAVDLVDDARVRRILETNAPALDLLGRAVDCRGSSYGLDYRAGPETELPPLAELLRAGRLVWVDGVVALAAGEVPRARRDLAILERLGGSLAEESMLITSLIALAVDRLYLDLVHRLVTSGAADQEMLAELAASLGRRDRHPAFWRSLAAEGSMSFELTTARMVESVAAGGPLRWLRLWLARPAGRLAIAALLDEVSAAGELAGRPWPDIQAASEKRQKGGIARLLGISLFPHLIDAMGKLEAGESTRLLALEAIRLRRGQLAGGASAVTLERPWIDPYSGGEVTVESRSDGSLRLEAPGAAERWRQNGYPVSRLGDPHFAWTLPPGEGRPPPAAGGPAASSR